MGARRKLLGSWPQPGRDATGNLWPHTLCLYLCLTQCSLLKGPDEVHASFGMKPSLPVSHQAAAANPKLPRNQQSYLEEGNSPGDAM